MAPIKLEEHIREQLQEREISPRSEAWDKLDAALGTNQKRNTTSWYWYAVAASVVGIMVATTVFWNESDTNPSPAIVINQEEIPTTKPEETLYEKSVISEPSEKAVDVASEIQMPSGRKATKTSSPSPEAENSGNRATKLTPSAIDLKKTETVVAAQNKMEEALVNDKIAQVVTQVQRLATENTNVTAEQIDALLTSAQRDLNTQRLLASPAGTVNPTALLEDVELELERSFRDKVFDALGDGFQAIRTAVAERNN